MINLQELLWIYNANDREHMRKHCAENIGMLSLSSEIFCLYLGD